MHVPLLFLLLSAVTPSAVNAAPNFEFQRVAQATISETQAIQIALRSVPGKVLSASLQEQGERSYYRVKILSNDGRVRTVTVDAQNGRVL
jgi:uncharacterized membrane protein YkoI